MPGSDISAVPPWGVAAGGYALAALAFLALSPVLLGAWRGRRHAPALGLACLVMALWAGGVALSARAVISLPAMPSDGHTLAYWINVCANLLEPLRSTAWLLFLLLLLAPSGQRLRVSLGLTGVIFLVQLWAGPVLGAATRLLQAVFGMLLVEQLYRNTASALRWGIKFACIGLGALFAYDFYLYSDALLFHQVNLDIWAARGYVNALSAPLLAISAARNPPWPPGLFVSRQVLFRSAALLGSAIYLLAMASSAYYIRYFNGAWGPVMQVAYLGGAVLLLAGVLFSGALRAKLKVYINKHFYSAIFDYRQEWLRFTRVLSEDGPAPGERAIQAVAQLVESPAGALWIAREHGDYAIAASWNLGAVPLPASEAADGALCRFFIARQWVVHIQDCQAQPSRYGQLRLPAWLDAAPQLWLLVPLMLHGRLFGFVALARPRAHISLNWEVTDLLKIAGSQAASYLAHRESADSLAVARQFESFNRMSTFIVHDLKNLVFQLSLLLSNAEKHKANPAFQDDMLATLEHSVRKMRLLLQKLGRGDTREPGAAPMPVAPVVLAGLLADAVAARVHAEPAPVLTLDEGAGTLCVLADRGRLERVLGHLVQNAVEASARDGEVAVHLARDGATAVIEVRDRGEGMSAEFIRERLFKPFESTKAAGMGVGAFESREYVRELGGRLDVASTPGKGTTFRVALPLHADADAAAAA